ncbi:MAG: tetratricopeptide repeat protein [Anaerolineae bacterium]|nr:tetratricopeptide repeat protein [Anaerolineae bacterium]
MIVYFFVRIQWHKQARDYLNAQQYEDAIRLYSRVIRFYPQDSLALANRANAYKQQGDDDAALADYNQAIAKGGRMSAIIYATRAYFLMYLGRHEEALADYQTALQADPMQSQSQLGIAFAYLFLKQYDNALAQAESAARNLEAQIAKNAEFGAYIVNQSEKMDAQLQTIYISTYATKALALVYLGRGDEAKAIYDDLAQKYPDSMVLYTDRAEIYFLLGEFALAVADYEKALDLATTIDHMPTANGYDLSHVAQSGYAVALFANGDAEKAQTVWREFLSKVPRLNSPEKVSKEFFWSEAMTAQAEKLVASLNT